MVDMTCAKVLSGGDVCGEGDEESPSSNCHLCVCAPNGPSSDSTVPSVATQADADEELRDFHLVLTTKNNKTAEEERITNVGNENASEEQERGQGLPAQPNNARPSVIDTRVANTAPPQAAASLAPSSASAVSATVSTIESPSARLPAVTFREAGAYMNYCMTMCCLEQYGVSTTKDSIFHSKDIPGISVRHYMERFFAHPVISPSAMLAGLMLIFRFSFTRFPVDIYSVHRFILTGASIGTKVQDDIHQGVPYLSALGGIKPEELITLQNTFCDALGWNLYFHTKDYRELLYVMQRLLEDPAPGELERFSVEHQEEIEAFNMKRLRVTVGMQWFRSECFPADGSACPISRATPSPSPTVTPSDLSEEDKTQRLKAVFALNRWKRVMKPWLEELKARCVNREEKIQQVMDHDLQECVKSPNSRLASVHQGYAWDRPSQMAYQLNTQAIQQHQAVTAANNVFGLPMVGSSYSSNVRFSDPRGGMDHPTTLPLGLGNGLYPPPIDPSSPSRRSAGGLFGATAVGMAAPFGMNGMATNNFGAGRDASGMMMGSRLGGFGTASTTSSSYVQRPSKKHYGMPHRAVPETEQQGQGGSTQPGMSKLTYAKPYVCKAAASSSTTVAEPTAHQRIIGHKRNMPSTFSDGYVQ